ncbi:tetratricopeptide repeat-containing sensor histidine kinase [uncultured Polaribacter sp.]|uniref:tetratricopeptide repeat-containing sensor histidine kinase n=1 Tax=uncultured Polaribacter sp. TaxID=174711 RepID=UPI0026231AC5|nr:tetratricopeptide repeat-containing sensor histidine kinase [uncultured Polaribacter sp.]
MKKSPNFFALNVFFFIAFLLSFNLFSQKKDSIVFYLDNAKKENKFLYLKRAIALSEELKNDSLIKKAAVAHARASYFAKNTVGLAFSKNTLLKHFKSSKDSFSLGKAYHLEALNYKLKNNLDSSFYYYQESKNIFIGLKDSVEVGRRLLSMAILQVKELDYLGSETTAVEGLKYIEPAQQKEYRTLISLYQTLGNALGHLNRPEESRASYIKAREMAKFNPIKSRRDINYLNLYNNIGATYVDEKNYEKAISLFEEGLRFDSVAIKYPRQYQNLLGSLSSVYCRQGKIKKAIAGYKTVLLGRQKSNYYYGQSVSHSLLAEAYLKTKQYALAKKHALKGLELGKQTRNTEQVLECYQFLSELSQGETAKKYFKAYVKLSDSLFARERYRKNQFAKVKYETEKKEKENINLKQENERNELLLESEKQQKTIGWLFAGAGVLCIGFGLSVVNSRRKKMLFDAKMQQIEAREKERQQIAKSLHDEVAGDIRMLHLKLAKTKQIEEAKSLDTIKENVRNLSHQLSSESFDKVSFKDQIIGLVSDYFEPDFRIKIQDIDSVDTQKVNNAIKRTLFLCARESIQNAKKYANAKELILSFKQTKKTVILSIADNGLGFDTQAKKNGIGLKNMKERVEEINGVFSVESELEKGTKITIEIAKNGK